tara:strand:- start:56 stop:613 length:558 start_codon:yes stop_codon:yes gene_type:complete
METEQKLIRLLFNKPNSKDILLLVTKLESKSNFIFSKDIEKLQGIWELRWSSSKAPFLNYSPFVDNLQILDPLKSSAMNLLKPKGINAIIGTGIIAKLKPINDIRVGVQFTHAGLIGPQIGFNKLKALAEIKKEQKGWLDITYLSKDLRICRGDKGTLFVLKKRSDEKLFKRFQEFIDNIFRKRE